MNTIKKHIRDRIKNQVYYEILCHKVLNQVRYQVYNKVLIEAWKITSTIINNEIIFHRTNL